MSNDPMPKDCCYLSNALGFLYPNFSGKRDYVICYFIFNINAVHGSDSVHIELKNW